jgi:hypothetical protein
MAKTKKDIVSQEHRATGLVSLAEGMNPFLKRLLGKTGLVQIDLLADWKEIVGETLAPYTLPQKIDFKKGATDNGVLLLAVRDGAFSLEVAHRKTTIIEKINTFFGYRAVADIRTVINDALFMLAPKNDDKKEKTLVNATQKKYITEVTDGIQNPELKAWLQRLGEDIIHNTK